MTGPEQSQDGMVTVVHGVEYGRCADCPYRIKRRLSEHDDGTHGAWVHADGVKADHRARSSP